MACLPCCAHIDIDKEEGKGELNSTRMRYFNLKSYSTDGSNSHHCILQRIQLQTRLAKSNQRPFSFVHRLHDQFHNHIDSIVNNLSKDLRECFEKDNGVKFMLPFLLTLLRARSCCKLIHPIGDDSKTIFHFSKELIFRAH